MALDSEIYLEEHNISKQCAEGRFSGLCGVQKFDKFNNKGEFDKIWETWSFHEFSGGLEPLFSSFQ